MNNFTLEFDLNLEKQIPAKTWLKFKINCDVNGRVNFQIDNEKRKSVLARMGNIILTNGIIK